MCVEVCEGMCVKLCEGEGGYVCVCVCKHTDHHPTSFDVAFRQYGTSVYVPGILLCGCTPDTSNLGGRRAEEIKDSEDGVRGEQKVGFWRHA